MPQDYIPWEQASAWDGPAIDFSDPINASLVSFWPLSEGRNGVTSTRDICGRNHATLNNYSGYPWVSGISGRGGMGQALPFNGSNQFVDAGGDASLNIAGKMTMAAWVNVAAFPANGQFANILAKKYDGTSIPYFFDLNGQVSSTLLRAGSFGGSGNNASWTIAGWTTGTWHLVCALNDTTNWIIDFDGNSVASLGNSTGAQANAGRLTLGCLDLTGTPGRFLNGKMAFARVWRRALTLGERRRLFLEPGAGIYHSAVSVDDYVVAAAGGGNTPLSVTLGQASWLATGQPTGLNTRLGATLGQAQWAANGFPLKTNTKLGQTLGQALWNVGGRPLAGLGQAAASLGLFPVRGSKENLRPGGRRGGSDAT